MGFMARGGLFQVRSPCCSQYQNFNFQNNKNKNKILEMQKKIDLKKYIFDLAVSQPLQIPTVKYCPCVPK